jgi:asparagine synthase (glutamine-hydrolysing)
LRKSFDGLLPQEIVWRKKEPIEYGSGSNKLHEIIKNMVSDEEFQRVKEKTGINFINKEHSFYYRIYSEVVGAIPEASGGKKGCPCCGAVLNKSYCRVCGFSLPLEKHST